MGKYAYDFKKKKSLKKNLHVNPKLVSSTIVDPYAAATLVAEVVLLIF